MSAVPAPAAPAQATAVCASCSEPVYFVEGLDGRERWRHVRTNDWRCTPVCKHCGQPGVVKIGHYDVDGGQMPVFRYSHHECSACCKRTFRIEHT